MKTTASPSSVILIGLLSLAAMKVVPEIACRARPPGHRISRGVVELAQGAPLPGPSADSDLPDFDGSDFLPTIRAGRRLQGAHRSGGAARPPAGEPDAAGRYRALFREPVRPIPIIERSSLARAFAGPGAVAELNGPSGEYVVDPEQGPLTFDGRDWVPTASRGRDR